jgi:3-dehydrosphinganine reductase
MGLALAKLMAQKGASVIVVARNVDKLKAAVESVSTAAPNPQSQRFHYISADLTIAAENERVIAEATTWNNNSPPDIVWANAGGAHPSLFADTPIDTLRQQMDLDYWAAAYLAHATLNLWITPAKGASRKDTEQPPRHFIITSSSIAFAGVAGYAPYAPAKSALRSLSDTLRSEINLYNGARQHASAPLLVPEIKNHIVLPGSILSPGLDVENAIKHPVTKMLEEGDPAQTGEEVAAAAVRALEKGGYMVTTQLLAHAMRAGMMGNSPRNGLGIVDTVFGWVVGVAWLFIGPDMERKVWRWGKEKGVAKT